MPIKTTKKTKQTNKKKGQNRPSEIRLSGVPPIMLIKTPEKKNKKQKRQNRPSEIRLSGVPPIMTIKTPEKK